MTPSKSERLAAVMEAYKEATAPAYKAYKEAVRAIDAEPEEGT